MNVRLSAPIGILDEHPEWSARLIAELEHRRLPYEKIDHSNHGFDPRDRARRFSVIVPPSVPPDRPSPGRRPEGRRPDEAARRRQAVAYLPLKFGLRFSKKALRPSRQSSDSNA